MPDESRNRLPIFPLENVVLFPGVRCPLHIFEPRYRQMAADALASDERIGMVTVQPAQTGEMGAEPPVFPVGCEGRIVESAALPDGRYNIVLLGTQRFRILEEPERPADQLYRSARVEPLDDALTPDQTLRLSALRSRSLELLGALIDRTHSDPDQRFDPSIFDHTEDATLVNALCQLIDLSPNEKQGLLEANGAAERGANLVALLEFRLAEIDGLAPPAPHNVH